jgi:hypothetical protein
MRETVGSLRLYFVIVAAIGIYSNVLMVLKQPTLLNVVLAVAGVALAAAYLYLAASLKRLIVEAPLRVQQVIMASAALVIVIAVIYLLMGSLLGAAEEGLSLLIIVYLWLNVRRLLAESQGPADGDHSEQ